MWTLDNIVELTNQNPILCVAIYNKFNWIPFSSKTWVSIKKFYGWTNFLFKWVIKFLYSSLVIIGLAVHLRNPITYIRDYDKISARWMNFWNDIEDWLWWYPFEYASTNEIIDFYSNKGFKVYNQITTEREGCNEFVFNKQ